MRIEMPLPQNKQNEPVEGEFVDLFLTGPIEPELCTELSKIMLEIDAKNISSGSRVPIQLYLNTPGGDLYSTWMLCDIMSTLQCTPVQTVGLGQVASGGFLIFMNGTPGMRIATTNTQFMSHRYIMAFEANHANIISQKPEWDRIHERIVKHYRKCTGLSVKDIEKHLLTEHDVWLTAEKCKEYKVCDIVVDTTGVPAKNNKIKNIKVDAGEPELVIKRGRKPKNVMNARWRKVK
jgi:ATP-dependent Clp protease protease subunit